MEKFINVDKQKLSKKFFLTLPEGVILCSNCGHAPDEPIFLEKVSPLSKREEQWQRIKDCYANQRHCHVFENESECSRFLKSIEIPAKK